MHLVHVRLHAAPPRPLPGAAAELVRSRSRPQDALEHVSVHRSDPARPVLGLYFAAASLERAETAALRITLRVLRTEEFHAFSVASCGVALTPYPGPPPSAAGGGPA